MKQQRKERRIDWDVEGYFHDWAKKRRKEVLAMEKAMDENPAFEESVEIQEGDSEEEILRKMEKDTELMHLDWRKGLSEEDWAKYTGKIERDRTRIWKHFIERNADYDYHYIFDIIKFKLEWVIFYWKNFGHLARAERDITRMRIAIKLISIIQNNGKDIVSMEKMPYVNVRNQHRFSIHYFSVMRYFEFGESQKVRFKKAHHLFFRFLEHHLLGWWD